MIDILLIVIAILILCVTGNILSFIGVRESLELVNKRLGMVLDERAMSMTSKGESAGTNYKPHPVTGRPIAESHEEHRPLRKKATGWQAAKNALEQASREPELKREETIRKNEEVLRG